MLGCRCRSKGTRVAPLAGIHPEGTGTLGSCSAGGAVGFPPPERQEWQMSPSRCRTRMWCCCSSVGVVATSLGTAGPDSRHHLMGHPQPCPGTPGVFSIRVPLGDSTMREEHYMVKGVWVAVPRDGTVPWGFHKGRASDPLALPVPWVSGCCGHAPPPSSPSPSLFSRRTPPNRALHPGPGGGASTTSPSPMVWVHPLSFPCHCHRRVLQKPRQLLHPGSGCWVLGSGEGGLGRAPLPPRSP